MVSGQFSIEFLVIWGVLLTVLAFVAMPLYENSRGDAAELTTIAEAHEAANNIARALNSVYAGGIGSKQTVEFWLPEDIVNLEPAKKDGHLEIEISFYSDLNYPNVSVATLLPADNVGFVNWIKIEPENRTLHRTTFTYRWKSQAKIKRVIVVFDNIIERKFVG